MLIDYLLVLSVLIFLPASITLGYSLRLISKGSAEIDVLKLACLYLITAISGSYILVWLIQLFL